VNSASVHTAGKSYRLRPVHNSISISDRIVSFMHYATDAVTGQSDSQHQTPNQQIIYPTYKLSIIFRNCMNFTGWPLSKQCEITWHFHDSRVTPA